MKETALLLGQMSPLVAVVTEPAQRCPRDLPAVILLNAGIIHRVGPNRLYVSLARLLASLGFVVLRFDLSGVGDSPVREDHLPFRKSAILETQEAMQHITTTEGIEQFVLMGICSGASLSYKLACRDPRVVAAVLINPWGHFHDTADSELNAHLRGRAMARHYWRILLFSSFRAKNWRKALTGVVDYHSILPVMLGSQLRELFTSSHNTWEPIEDIEADLQRLAKRHVRLLHVYSEGDEGLDYFRMMTGARLHDWKARGLLDVRVIRGANHTFTLLWSQDELLQTIRSWAQTLVQEQSSHESEPAG